MRYKAIIEYDGTAFIGWQRQKYAKNSVQETIEGAIYDFTQQRVEVYAAGRTDAGVHALGQVIHFDLRTHLSDYVIKNALNHYLRSYMVSILSLEEVGSEFHSRFSARKRHYVYKIANRDAPLSLDQFRMWHIPKRLDVDSMVEASSHIVGRKDFSSFRAKQCQSKLTVKTIDKIIIDQDGCNIRLHISALSFLYKQVRIIVGTLVCCGKGVFPPVHLVNILEQKDRSAAGITAPPHGLYLVSVDY